MRRWLTAAALSLGIAAGAVPAAHAAAPAADSDTPTQSSSSFFGTQSCPQQPVQQPLVDVGDAGWYYLVQNGSFTEGTNAWSTSGPVTVVNSSSPQDVMSAGGGSLALGSYGSATSARFCTASDHDRARLFYRSPGVPGLTLVVRITSTSNLWLRSSYTTTYRLDGSTPGWKLSPTMVVPDWTDWTGVQQTSITLRASGGTFQVDDVMVDPWRYNTP